ncbi:MAG: hypothetical protein KBF62_01355 [Candidatus Pacebacteria bacterium]|nr:hypothetical protein [Candidatus Paceibacterota bacterium]MBP9058267.1 hypothetical protein [Candidatus Paceibacterota bacterium]MBP9770506.1 hypothetical protein [Candidatus Paceibacterota bacterium]
MTPNSKATQEFVPIKEIRDGVIILKDGGLRGVLMASSINLSLKSADEQEATLSQFQSFLNSLEFSVQIVIQSRKYDVKPYILSLEGLLKDQTEPLLKIQTREYIQYIRKLTEEINIMTKTFYVVVSYSPSVISNSSVSGPLSGFLSKNKGGQNEKELDFEEKRSQLEQRIGVVQQGLNRCGVRSQQLGSAEVVELFYKIFNPGDSSVGMTAGIQVE